MKIKMLILLLFFKLSIFPSVTLFYTFGHFSSKFSHKLLDLGLWNLWRFWLFSESVTTSDGYRRGYVSFAHFLLYLPRLLNIWNPDILPRIINCYDVHAYMPQHHYLASYVCIITVYTSLYYILKDKISNLTTYTCVTASTDLSAFYLFIRQKDV